MQDAIARRVQIDELPVRSGGHFVGRTDLLEQLDNWYGSDRPIAVLLAQGGAGKTALARHWLMESKLLTAAFSPPRNTLLVVHSFYGQADSDRSVVDEALLAIFESVAGKQVEPPASSDALVDAIVRYCNLQAVLLVLDGFETQQNDEGMIAVDCLPLEDLIRHLGDIRHCKLLLTTRVSLVQNVPAPSFEELPVPLLGRDDACQLLQGYLPKLTRVWISNFTNRFFSHGSHALTLSLILDAVRDTKTSLAIVFDKPESVLANMFDNQDPTGILDVLLVHSFDELSENARTLLILLALSDVPLEKSTAALLAKKIERSIAGAFRQLAGRQLVLQRKEALDLHPLVRERLSFLMRARNSDLCNLVHTAIATQLESEALASDRRQQLSLLYRTLLHKLQAGDLMGALERTYLSQMSGESPPFGSSSTVWRSIRQDFSYALENKSLDAIGRVLQPAAQFNPTLNLYLDALMRRQLFVRRAMGLITSADTLGQSLASNEKSGGTDSSMSAQACLTKLICGRVKFDPDDPEGAAFWSIRALQFARAKPRQTDRFPEVRALVYRGAYLHRLDSRDSATEAFQQAEAIQAEMHHDNPAQPPCLMGLNAYLHVWFLVDSGRIAEAQHLLKRNHRVIDEMVLREEQVPHIGQWQLMTLLSDVWVNQELALQIVTKERRLALSYLRTADVQLTELQKINSRNRWNIAYDMRSTFVRAEIRQRMLLDDPETAAAELERHVSTYERSGAMLFAADCQTDLLRLYHCSDLLPRGWSAPKPCTMRDAAKRLVDLAIHYPLADQVWRRRTPLRQFSRQDLRAASPIDES